MGSSEETLQVIISEGSPGAEVKLGEGFTLHYIT